MAMLRLDPIHTKLLVPNFFLTYVPIQLNITIVLGKAFCLGLGSEGW